MRALARLAGWERRHARYKKLGRNHSLEVSAPLALRCCGTRPLFSIERGLREATQPPHQQGVLIANVLRYARTSVVGAASFLRRDADERRRRVSGTEYVLYMERGYGVADSKFDSTEARVLLISASTVKTSWLK